MQLFLRDWLCMTAKQIANIKNIIFAFALLPIIFKFVHIIVPVNSFQVNFCITEERGTLLKQRSTCIVKSVCQLMPNDVTHGFKFEVTVDDVNRRVSQKYLLSCKY